METNHYKGPGQGGQPGRARKRVAGSSPRLSCSPWMPSHFLPGDKAQGTLSPDLDPET